MTDFDLNLVIFLILAAAAFRVTRLVVIDDITAPLRNAWTGLLATTPSRFAAWISDLFTCTWCAGVWVSTAVYAIYLGDSPHTFTRVDWLVAAGIAGVQGLLHAFEPDEA